MTWYLWLLLYIAVAFPLAVILGKMCKRGREK
jgi:hypothetical protein